MSAKGFDSCSDFSGSPISSGYLWFFSSPRIPKVEHHKYHQGYTYVNGVHPSLSLYKFGPPPTQDAIVTTRIIFQFQERESQPKPALSLVSGSFMVGQLEPTLKCFQAARLAAGRFFQAPRREGQRFFLFGSYLTKWSRKGQSFFFLSVCVCIYIYLSNVYIYICTYL